MPTQTPGAAPTVYLVQEPLKRDQGGNVVSRFNMAPLERYGRIVCLTSWGELRHGFPVDEIVAKLREKLQHFCDRDFICPVGNPALIALVTLVAADINEGRVRILDWQREESAYREVRVNMDWLPYASS